MSYSPDTKLSFFGTYVPSATLRFGNPLGVPYTAVIAATIPAVLVARLSAAAQTGPSANAHASLVLHPQLSASATLSSAANLNAALTLHAQFSASATFAERQLDVTCGLNVAINLGVSLAITANANTNVWRGVCAAFASRATAPGRMQHVQQSAYNLTQPIPTVRKQLSVDGLPLNVHKRYIYSTAADSRLTAQVTAKQINGGYIHHGRKLLWSRTETMQPTVRSRYSTAKTADVCVRSSYLQPKSLVKNSQSSWLNDHSNCSKSLRAIYSHSKPVSRHKRFIYTHGHLLTPGVHIYIPALWPSPSPPPIYVPTTTLRLRCLVPPYAELRFCEPQCLLFTVPIQDTYIVTNSFSLIRIDNNVPLYAITFNLSLSADSWTWTWNAKVAGRQISDVLSTDPLDPIEVLATLNGEAFKLVVETIARDRAFNSDVISMSGRGTSAYLAAPYAPISTVFSSAIINAQQAALLALEINNVPIGWSVDWGIDDWSIAGGAFSSTGTYIEHLQRIAEAGGAYLQPDKTADTMHFLPYYPTAPWGWDTLNPTLSLPEDIFVTEGIKYSNKANYNGVYVSGGANGGRLDLIKITNTAGDLLAPTVVDNLATDVIMTRQRGMRILGDTGREVRVTLRLPIMPQTGIILPGTMLQYIVCGVSKIGIVRSTVVNYALPNVSQTVEIESHEYL